MRVRTQDSTVSVHTVLAACRYNRIREGVHADGSVEVRALAELLDVSETTVRRDLDRVLRSGRKRRGTRRSRAGHGGPCNALIAARDDADKDAIATAAAELVRDGDVVMLGPGSTVHGLVVYDELTVDESVQLILLHPAARRDDRSLVGNLTQQTLRLIGAHRLLLCTGGIRHDGIHLDDAAADVPIQLAMLNVADEVVVLTDPGRFPGSGLARGAGTRRSICWSAGWGRTRRSPCSRMRAAGSCAYER